MLTWNENSETLSSMLVLFTYTPSLIAMFHSHLMLGKVFVKKGPKLDDILVDLLKVSIANT